MSAPTSPSTRSGGGSARAAALHRRARRTIAVAVAARDLPGGQPLAADDVTTELFHPGSVPQGAYRPHTVPLGRIVAGPVRRGLPLTDAAVVGPGLAAQLGAGEVLTTIHVRDPAAELVAPGDLVQVVATDPRGSATAQVVAEDASVLSVPDLGVASTAGSGTSPLVLAVPESSALALSGAATSRVLDILVPAPGGR